MQESWCRAHKVDPEQVEVGAGQTVLSCTVLAVTEQGSFAGRAVVRLVTDHLLANPFSSSCSSGIVPPKKASAHELCLGLRFLESQTASFFFLLESVEDVKCSYIPPKYVPGTRYLSKIGKWWSLVEKLVPVFLCLQQSHPNHS